MINLQPTSVEEFRITCSAIANRWRGMIRDQEKPIPWLEQQVYVLTEHLLAYDLYDELTEPRLRTLSRRGRSKKPNPFSQIIRVIFWNEGNAPNRQLRSRMGRRLEHAYWHFIPPEFLACFLKEAGTEPKFGKVQPGYEQWLLTQLQASRNSEVVHLYPKQLRPDNNKRLRQWREPESLYSDGDRT